jgi:exopolysaccharide biosynthesis polyprenyl glycosylphosphotransferase
MSTPETQLEPIADEALRPRTDYSPRRIRLRNPFSRVASRSRPSSEELAEGLLGEATYKRDGIYRRSLAVADVAAAALAVLAGVPILGADTLNPLALLALPLVLVVGKVSGLYDRDEHLLRKTTLDEVPTLFGVATLYSLLIWLGGDLIVEGHFGRDQAVGVWALLFLAMLATRALARSFARAASTEERCLVLGDAKAADSLRRRLEEAPGLKARVVASRPLEHAAVANGGRGHGNVVWLNGKGHGLEALIRAERVERAIIAPRGAVSDDLLDTTRRLKALGVRVSMLPSLFEVLGSSVERDEVDGITLLAMRRYGLGRSSRAIKRSFDLIGAGLGVLLLSPLLAAFAIAIKLDSSGPVLFRQRRMGRHGVPFDMFKFRTMVDGADAQKSALAEQNEADGGLFKIKDDPRITRVGRRLRRCSLDELPQLLNVLRGDMSLVGPRPLVLDEDRRIEGWQRSRLELPPGMTGPWQVFGSARIPLDEMVKIDYLYGANWSLWLDVKTLLRTVPFVVGGRGL